jgi:two-component system sensor histidine kinase TtrS
LSDANRELEHEMQERQRAEDRARQHEAELAHVSRVSVIGEMTSGLAHELRQPLAAINNYVEGGLRRLDRRAGDGTDLREALDMIRQQTSRAGQIITRVRGYIQKREPEHEPVRINHAIEEAAALIRQDARVHGVHLHLELASGLPAVSGDLIELEQLVINLAKNAIDAMATPDCATRDLTIATSPCAGGVCIEVIDTGPGLDAADRETMWEPFHSRKPGGLGLGLAICRTIVEKHGGRIRAEDGRPHGTALIIELPALTETADAD